MNDQKTLEFYYGTVNSAKSMTLLAKHHAWNTTGKNVCIVKPATDTRANGVASRIGISEEADIVLSSESTLKHHVDLLKDKDLILVDEVQFLTSEQIMELRMLSIGLMDEMIKPVTVQCFGLRTLSNGELWDSVKTLMAQADVISEIPTVCAFCSEKAAFSKALNDTEKAGVKISWGSFIPVCAYHFFHKP